MTTDDRPFVRGMPCLLCERRGCDPHHYPVRKSKGAGNTLEEMVPLCRICHDKVHGGDNDAIRQLEKAAEFHFKYIRRLLNGCEPER